MRIRTSSILLLIFALPSVLGAEPSLSFVEEALARGIDFVHQNGARGNYFMPEIFGAGVALLDIDGDGDLDLLAVQSGEHGGQTSGAPTSAPLKASTAARLGQHRLWRQDADGRFEDITQGAGLTGGGYGMGVAAGDIDGDGLDDLFITAFTSPTHSGGDKLYLNRGGGRFEDITRASGLEASTPAWSASALFFDFDADRDLDLFVVRYLRYEPPLACSDQAGRPDYCGPGAFAPSLDRLWRQGDDGRFTDISEEAGLLSAGKGLGAVAADFDGDGRLDLYVANDGEPNRLWLQEKPGRFVDRAVENGAAVDALGRPQAGMGIALGDIDGDGLSDLFLSHLRSETNTLYRADAELGFLDATATSGLGGPSLPWTGFGAVFADLDLDADLDLVITNGGVTRGPRAAPNTATNDAMSPEASALENDRRDYGQKNLAFVGSGSRFDPVDVGALTESLAIGRGLARGDLDNDGDIDLVQTSSGGRLRLFTNTNDSGHSWSQIQVRGPAGGIAEQARVKLTTTGGAGAVQTRILSRGQSYLSSHDPRLFFGLGDDSTRIEELEIEHLGHRQRYLNVPANRRLLVTLP